MIIKPWGKETILTPENTPYTAKILEITAGHRLSLQYHDQKIETLILVSGNTKIIWGNDINTLITENMTPFKPYHIIPKTVHRLVALTNSKIIEASTPETGTTVRIEDDNKRSDETPTIRNLPNRGWTPPQNEVS